MSIERIIHKTGNFTRKAVASGILGLCAIVAGAVPAHAQQNAKTPSANIVYVPCTPQQTTAKEGEKENYWGNILTAIGLAGTFSKDKTNQEIGSAFLYLAEKEQQKEVAEIGRSQININQGQPQQVTYVPAFGCKWKNPDDTNDLSVRKRIGMPFAANSWRDFNNDGVGDLNEYVGVKKKFYSDENIMMVLHGMDPKVKEDIKWEMYYGPNVYKYEEGLITDRKSVPIRLMPNGNPGNYVIVWRSQGIAEMTKFEIVPASERPEKNQ